MGSPVNTISSKAFSNLLINGGMRVDQRRAGASLTLGTGASSLYVCDRWRQDRDIGATTVTSRSTATPPVGFSHFQRLSVTTGVTVTAAQFSEWIQPVEAVNTANIRFGTADAKSLGLSFWVRSSIAGSNSGVVRNSASRSYVFTFTINAANTWEYKEVTIPGDTSGTWPAGDTSLGLILGFCHSAGTTYRTTAGSWQAGIFVGATGGNNITAVTGATYDLTGVQLKIGAPREYEHRSIGEEVLLCQRYYEKSFDLEQIPGNGPNTTSFINNLGLEIAGIVPWASGNWGAKILFKTVKRVTPLITSYGNSNGHWCYSVVGTFAGSAAEVYATNLGPTVADTRGMQIANNVSTSALVGVKGHWSVDAEF